MIDFNKVEKTFKDYLKAYNLEDGYIKLKIKHTYEVMRKSEYIANNLKLDNENIELAKLIALLHDLGRFEQAKKTNSFIDGKQFDHADYGVKILFEDNLIRQFIEDNSYDEIIKKAIYNHNKYQIEDNLNETELLHSKIIRDADKLDIFRVMEEDDFKNIFIGMYNKDTLDYEEISQNVYNNLINNKCVLIKDRKTQIDCWACIIGFIFDLNFKTSLEYVKEKKYIDVLINRIDYKNKDTKQKMEQIRKNTKEYIEKNIL